MRIQPPTPTKPGAQQSLREGGGNLLRLGDHDRLAAVILPGQGTLFITLPLHPPYPIGGSRLNGESSAATADEPGPTAVAVVRPPAASPWRGRAALWPSQ